MSYQRDCGSGSSDRSGEAEEVVGGAERPQVAKPELATVTLKHWRDTGMLKGQANAITQHRQFVAR